MANDKTVEYAITADPAAFKTGIDAMVASARDAAAKMDVSFKGMENTIKSSTSAIETQMKGISSAFSSVKSSFMAITAVVAGGAAFKAAISESAAWSGEAKKLGVQLGESTERASVMMVAMRHLGIDSDLVTTASTKMSKQIFSNGQAFEKMGVQTKDAAGQYRPVTTIMSEVNDKLKAIQNPIEQNIAGMQVYGKGWQEIRAILKLTPEVMQQAEQKARDLNLIVGDEGAAASKKYKESLNDMALVATSLEVQLGNAVMPAFVALGAWMSGVAPVVGKAFGAVLESMVNIMATLADVVKALWGVVSTIFSSIGQVISAVFGTEGPGAMEVFTNALKVVEIAFVVFKGGVEFALEAVKVALVQIVAGVMRFANTAERALHMDFAGAKAAWKQGTEEIVAIQKEGAQQLVDVAKKTADQIDGIAMRAPKKQAEIKDKKASGGPQYDFEKEKKDPNDKGRVPVWDADLKEQQVAFQKANDMREMSKAQIAQYWQDVQKLQEKSLTPQEATALRRKIAESELEVMRKSVSDKRALSEEEISNHVRISMEILDLDQMQAQQQYELGNTSKSQLLQQERAFLEARYQVELEAQEARVAIAEKDKENNIVAYQKELDKREDLTRKHVLNMQHINGKIAVDANTDWKAATNSMRSTWESATASMLSGQMTFRKGLQTIWNGILQSFSQFVTKRVTAWVLGESAQTTATEAGNAIRTESDWMAATQSVLASAWAAVKNIATKAWEVAASVYSAIAGIPYIGPFLAPVMAIAATGAVLAFASNVASAEGGFDIPSGMNPMTQLHEKEMVLPAKHADVIRSLADGGTAGGAGGMPDIHIHAMDSHDVRRALSKGGALNKELNKMYRNFTK